MKTKTPKTRAAMIEFLAGHFRYSTMNSWDNGSSYAANVKIHRLNLPRELEDKAYEALEVEESFDDVRAVLREFAEAHNWNYQIGFNGRSGGYLVLYKGGRKLSESKSFCQDCGQRNFKTVEETAGDTCGRCNSDARVNHTFYETFTTGEGTGTNDKEELAEWATEDLRAEVKLVREFDETVERARLAFIDTLKGSEIVEESYTVTKTRKVLAPKEG